MLDRLEHIFNELNYKISTCDKSLVKGYMDELRKLYVEILYYYPSSDEGYAERRYLLDYYQVIHRKGMLRIE